MTSSLDRVLSDRFARQHEELPEADFAEVRRRARRLSSQLTAATVGRRLLSRRLPTRVLLVAAVIAIAAVGAATALAVHALTQSPVTQGFSALDDPSLPPAPASVMRQFSYFGAGDIEPKEVGDGMYLGQRDGALCADVIHGFGGCEDHLDGDVWLQGDEGREYDAETAPFQVHLYGFARDDVATIRVTTADGTTVALPVVHNAFQATFKNTAFADITAIEVVYSSGQTTSLDPSKYFPKLPPTLNLTTPTGTTTMTRTN
jgi:hypothetical protein